MFRIRTGDKVTQVRGRCLQKSWFFGETGGLEPAGKEASGRLFGGYERVGDGVD